MPALSPGISSDCASPVLDIFTTVNGVPADVSKLQFQIFEKVSNPTVPQQVYPAGGRQNVNLQDCPTGGRLGQGHYVADWTVPQDSIIGTHEIRWFLKLFPNSEEQTFQEEFEVLAIPAPETYISVQDVRDAGLTDETAFPDAKVHSEIVIWQTFIERATRQWFRPRTLEFNFDGTDSDTIHFGIPIISIEALRINDDPNDLESDKYQVYSEIVYPDDRHNPRIKLVNGRDTTDIFTQPFQERRRIFRKGRQNQYVKGVFGYVEEGDQPPEMIKRAMTKLVIEKCANPLYVDPSATAPAPPPLLTGLVSEEWTDGHKIKYGAQRGGARNPRRPSPWSGITEDPEIQDIILMFRAPIGIATPANVSFTAFR